MKKKILLVLALIPVLLPPIILNQEASRAMSPSQLEIPPNWSPQLAWLDDSFTAGWQVDTDVSWSTTGDILTAGAGRTGSRVWYNFWKPAAVDFDRHGWLIVKFLIVTGTSGAHFSVRFQSGGDHDFTYGGFELGTWKTYILDLSDLPSSTSDRIWFYFTLANIGDSMQILMDYAMVTTDFLVRSDASTVKATIEWTGSEVSELTWRPGLVCTAYPGLTFTYYSQKDALTTYYDGATVTHAYSQTATINVPSQCRSQPWILIVKVDEASFIKATIEIQ